MDFKVDVWHIVEQENSYKVLASWNKLPLWSKEMMEVEDKGYFYIVTDAAGDRYMCGKETQGLDDYTAGPFNKAAMAGAKALARHTIDAMVIHGRK